MNTQVVFVPLDKVIVNHYQTGFVDRAKVLEIMESVKRYRDNGNKGLLQLPLARLNADGCYEMAFGRHRLAAFQDLFTLEADAFFSEIPLTVAELSDQEMFELMGLENLTRRDISILEIGETFHRHMELFQQTSVETAKAFGKTEEYVRSAIRMLNLPDVAKTMVQEGALNITGARAILTLQKVLPGHEEALQSAVNDIVDEHDDPEHAVENVLQQYAKIIGNEANTHFSMKQKTFKYLPTLTVKEGAELVGGDWSDYHDKGVMQNYIDSFTTGKKKPTDFPELANEDGKLDTLYRLINPPACTACPLFAQVDGTGYCGWSACFDRKEEATQQELLHKTSEKTGIAVLTADDGKHLELNHWNEKHKNYFNKKGADLRLKLGRRGYANWDGVPSDLGVVVVGKTLETWKKQEQKTDASIASHENKPQIDYQRQRNIQRIVEAQISLFAWEVIVPAFAVLLKEIKSEKLLYRFYHEMQSHFNVPDEFDETFADEKKFAQLSKPARLNFLHRAVAFYFLDEDLEYVQYEKITHNEKNPASVLAKHFQDLAQESGVKLPKDLAQKAQTYDDAVKLAISELDGAK